MTLFLDNGNKSNVFERDLYKILKKESGSVRHVFEM